MFIQYETDDYGPLDELTENENITSSSDSEEEKVGLFRILWSLVNTVCNGPLQYQSVHKGTEQCTDYFPSYQDKALKAENNMTNEILMAQLTQRLAELDISKVIQIQSDKGTVEHVHF